MPLNPQLLEYNFAPPMVRRDIGILDLIHKRVLGLAHPAYSVLMPFCPPSRYAYRGIFAARHNKQLISGTSQCIVSHALMFRFILGMVDLYNRLPQRLVDITDVNKFQTELTVIVRDRCSRNCPNWQYIFNTQRFFEHASQVS